jgi:hypothetical protein
MLNTAKYNQRRVPSLWTLLGAVVGFSSLRDGGRTQAPLFSTPLGTGYIHFLESRPRPRRA